MKKLSTEQLIELAEQNQGHLMGTVLLEGRKKLMHSWEQQTFDLVNTAKEDYFEGQKTGKEFTFLEAHEDETMRFAFKVLVDACPEEEKVAYFENLSLIQIPMSDTCVAYLMYV